MDLDISVFLLFVLFTAGHSFKCYHCTCEQTTACNASSNCFTATAYLGENRTVVKNCSNDGPSGSINLGNMNASFYCCNTQLSNIQDVPDPSNNTSNGKTCYYFNGQSCLNIFNCSESEDRCFTQTGIYRDAFSKGCVSESVCNDTAFIPLILNLTCCDGNLCNGDNATQSSSFTQSSSSTQSTTQSSSSTHSTTKSANSAQSVTQSFLFLCCSLLSFILLH